MRFQFLAPRALTPARSAASSSPIHLPPVPFCWLSPEDWRLRRRAGFFVGVRVGRPMGACRVRGPGWEEASAAETAAAMVAAPPAPPLPFFAPPLAPAGCTWPATRIGIMGGASGIPLGWMLWWATGSGGTGSGATGGASRLADVAADAVAVVVGGATSGANWVGAPPGVAIVAICHCVVGAWFVGWLVGLPCRCWWFC